MLNPPNLLLRQFQIHHNRPAVHQCVLDDVSRLKSCASPLQQLVDFIVGVELIRPADLLVIAQENHVVDVLNLLDGNENAGHRRERIAA